MNEYKNEGNPKSHRALIGHPPAETPLSTAVAI